MPLIWLALALLVLAGIVAVHKWWFGTAQPPRNSEMERKTYPAVGVRYNLRACKAVQQYYDQRFLARDAPALPVAGCNLKRCPCRYIHYADRRTGEDRRVHYGAQRNLNSNIAAQRRRGERRQALALS